MSERMGFEEIMRLAMEEDERRENEQWGKLLKYLQSLEDRIQKIELNNTTRKNQP